jgi:threonine dehydratase
VVADTVTGESKSALCLRDVIDASNRIRGKSVYTPLLEFPFLNELVGGRVLLKAESLQRTGSFKFRGALNRLSKLDARQRRAGIVAWSSGNHGIAVSAVSQLLAVPCTVIVPTDVPKAKLEKIRLYNPEVRLYDRAKDSREALAQTIAAESRRSIVPSFDDDDVVAGQGTCGLEIVEQCRNNGILPDILLIPCGGGGLTAGCSLVFKNQLPKTKVYSVEPQGFDDTLQSLRLSKRIANSRLTGSICDALLAPMPGERTFSINQRYLDGGLAVSDDDVRKAIAFAYKNLGLITEPSGVIGLAALLTKQIAISGRTCVVIISGANVDVEVLVRTLDVCGQVGSPLLPERASDHNPGDKPQT